MSEKQPRAFITNSPKGMRWWVSRNKPVYMEEKEEFASKDAASGYIPKSYFGQYLQECTVIEIPIIPILTGTVQELLKKHAKNQL